jgi:peroxiredoxin Q/BCP
MVKLVPGDTAPAFNLKDQNEKSVALTSFKGKKLLVYFYPKADTSG